jgi:hypothetical protein
MSRASHKLGVFCGALALGIAAIPAAGPAAAGAVAVAKSQVVLTVDEVVGGTLGSDVIVTYRYDPASATRDSTQGGTGYGSAIDYPSAAVMDTLGPGIFEEQQAYSDAGAYRPSGSGFGALASEGYLTLNNTTNNAVIVRIGYEANLSVESLVSGAPPFFADAYARAVLAIFDETLEIDLGQQLTADFANGSTDAPYSSIGSFNVVVRANAERVIAIQTQTQAQAQFVPAPAPLALMATGLVALGLTRRRSTSTESRSPTYYGNT